MFNNFLKKLLCKKVSERECSFRGLKATKLYENYDFDALIDLKMPPTFIPETEDYSQMIRNTSSRIEVIIKNTVGLETNTNELESAEVSEDDDFNFNWAEDF